MRRKKTIIIEPGAADLARKGAETFLQVARESAGMRGRFVVAVSGGSTPRTMHRMLAEEPYLSDIPWPKTHIFLVDERCVPENDPANNYGAAKKDFLDRVPVPKAQIHPMPVDIYPEDGALAYQKELIRFFQPGVNGFPVFDLIFLGIGVDGHTASLFPGQKPASESTRLVVSVKGGYPDVTRLSMTCLLLNKARLIVFLVSGKRKSRILKTIFENRHAGLPAQEINPDNGRLIWLLDQEAASLLPGGTAVGI